MYTMIAPFKEIVLKFVLNEKNGVDRYTSLTEVEAQKLATQVNVLQFFF